MDKLFDMARKYTNATKPLRTAVCVCATKGNQVLAVARRGTEDQWGLPGGKVDSGEAPLEALIREVWEEAHIKLDKTKLTPVFYRFDPPFYVTTYMYDGNITEIPEQGDAGPAAWVSWNKLLSGPFGKYNARLKEKLGL